LAPEQIQEGTELVESALRLGANGVYALQAAIAALHANAKTAKERTGRRLQHCMTRS